SGYEIECARCRAHVICHDAPRERNRRCGWTIEVHSDFAAVARARILQGASSDSETALERWLMEERPDLRRVGPGIEHRIVRMQRERRGELIVLDCHTRGAIRPRIPLEAPHSAPRIEQQGILHV